MTIKHIVMAGGAYNGIYIIGALKHLIEKSFFDIANILRSFAPIPNSLVISRGIIILVDFSSTSIISDDTSSPLLLFKK